MVTLMMRSRGQVAVAVMSLVWVSRWGRGGARVPRGWRGLVRRRIMGGSGWRDNWGTLTRIKSLFMIIQMDRISSALKLLCLFQKLMLFRKKYPLVQVVFRLTEVARLAWWVRRQRASTSCCRRRFNTIRKRVTTTGTWTRAIWRQTSHLWIRSSLVINSSRRLLNRLEWTTVIRIFPIIILEATITYILMWLRKIWMEWQLWSKPCKVRISIQTFSDLSQIPWSPIRVNN